MKDYSQLYRKIGYKFNNPEHINRALTHKSKSKNNYERVEFLGDSILGFIIAEALYLKFPKENEGKLSQIRTKLVKGNTLAELALKLGINDFIILGAGEISAGGHQRKSLLEDVLEAIIGAIYLDSKDFNIVKNCVLKWFEPILNNLDISFQIFKDNKSKLQEILTQNNYNFPKYQITDTKGKDHEKIIIVSLTIQELNIFLEIADISRKKAEQKLAEKAINLLAEKGLYEKKKK